MGLEVKKTRRDFRSLDTSKDMAQAIQEAYEEMLLTGAQPTTIIASGKSFAPASFSTSSPVYKSAWTMGPLSSGYYGLPTTFSTTTTFTGLRSLFYPDKPLTADQKSAILDAICTLYALG